jgi:Phosphotransferase enzyme family
VNIVDVGSGDAGLALVEKCVEATSSELAFWRDVESTSPVLHADLYNSVRPIDIVVRDPVAFLYFPYVPALDRAKETQRRAFRENMHTITSAIADFNGRNLSPIGTTSAVEPFPLTRPTRHDLQRRLDLLPSAAEAIEELWEKASGRWEAIRHSYEQLPTCLNHNDISPNNAVYTDETVILADFGLASTGMVGGDLHTIIKWSARAAHDPAHVDALVTTYVEQIRQHLPSVTAENVRMAAWATFFLRYTNLKYSSSRYIHSYGLALNEMLKLQPPVT